MKCIASNGVMETRLKDRDSLAGDYSIADVISWPWVSGWSLNALMTGRFPPPRRVEAPHR